MLSKFMFMVLLIPSTGCVMMTRRTFDEIQLKNRRAEQIQKLNDDTFELLAELAARETDSKLQAREEDAVERIQSHYGH